MNRLGMFTVVLVCSIVLVVAVAPLAAEEADGTYIAPQHCDTGYIASTIWGQTYTQKQLRNYYPHFAVDMIKEALDGLPKCDRQRISKACGWTYALSSPEESFAACGSTPELSLCENWILAPDDKAMTAIQAVDIARPGIMLDVIVIDWPERDKLNWCEHWRQLPPDAYAKSLAVTSETVPPYAYGVDTNHKALRYVEDNREWLTEKRRIVETQLFVPADAQGIVALGEVVPIRECNCCKWVSAQPCDGIYRVVSCCIPECGKAIFRGVELWVRPGGMVGNTMALSMRPRFVEWAGTICRDEQYPVPITRYQSSRFDVSLAGGQSIVIYPLHRDNYILNQNIAGFDRKYRYELMRDPVIIMTPTAVQS